MIYRISNFVCVHPLNAESANQTPILVQPPSHQSLEQANQTTSTSSTDVLEITANDSMVPLLLSPTTPTNQSGDSAQSPIGTNIQPPPPNTPSDTTSYQLFPDQQPTTSQTNALSSPQMAAASSNTFEHTTQAFAVNELVWGPVRGHPAWPGKVVSPPDGVATTTSDSTWVQWFGGRPHHIELVAITALKSLSEGLDAHHRAQKDTRK